MFGMSLTEILVILLVTLIVLGPERLPELARTMGKWMREIRRASNTFRDAFMIEGDSRRSQEERFRKMLEGEEDGPIDVPADQAGPPGSVPNNPSNHQPTPMPTPGIRPVALQEARRANAQTEALRTVEMPPARPADTVHREEIETAPLSPW